VKRPASGGGTEGTAGAAEERQRRAACAGSACDQVRHARRQAWTVLTGEVQRAAVEARLVDQVELDRR
jgi:hypothetical protein